MSTLRGRLLLTSLLATVVVLAALAGGPSRANAQITGLAVDNNASSTSVTEATGQNLCTTDVLGTTAPLGGNVGESRNIITVTAQTPTSFTTRFIADLCTDSGGSTITSTLTFSCGPGGNSKSLTAEPRINFGIAAPSGTNYRMKVNTNAAGELDYYNDGGGGASGNVSNMSTSLSGSSQFGGGSLFLSTATGGGAFGAASGNVTFTGGGAGGPIAQQIASSWSAACSTPSDGQECVIRIGLPCSITGGPALLGDTSFGPEAEYPGSPSRNQATDGQFVNVNLEFCGDGIIQQDGVLNEQCDNGQDPVTGNGGTNSCCTIDCQVRSNGSTCRPVADECDVTEVCNGISPACPADLKKANNTPCTDDGNPCSNDVCNGVSNACQHPPGHASALCRGSVDLQCDPPEFCTGLSTTCPADVRQPDTFGCTSDGNPCTVDHCDQASGTCVHTAGNVGTVCRVAADTCDAAETCNGFDTACPPDLKKPDGTTCPDDGKLCTHDLCDGVHDACQHPGANAGEVCRPAVDPVCDIDEVCDGTNPDCPPDAIETRQINCRDPQGPCDTEEYCTGTDPMCPPDSKVAAGTICRPQVGGADGLCDVAEACDGVHDLCCSTFQSNDPASPCDIGDGVAPSGTICHDVVHDIGDPSIGACDVAETCDGTLKTCPPDELASSAVVCRDVAPGAAGICDEPEYCTGTYANCPFDLKVPAFSLNCRPAVSFCDVSEYCDGINNTCPVDGFAPPQPCRAVAGVCDAEESCTGTSADCPPDGFQDTSVVCRSSAGLCDIAEHCTGTGADCPVDSFKPTTTICRPLDPLNSDCDVEDACTGTDAACPPDAKKPDGTLCVGANSNTCLNGCVTGVCTDACPGHGDINDAGCPTVPAAVVPLCCGNGVVDPTEQCDDGNQLSGGDACPSLPSDDCQIGASGGLIRGNIRNPLLDKGGCQVEYSVLNPNAPLDKFLAPNMIQTCEDQDPTCDLDPRPGRCRFHVVACLNNTDPNLPACTPEGLNSLVILNRPYLRKSSPQVTLVGGNIATLSHNLQALYDPANPGLGFSLSPPLDFSQQGLCTGGMLVDVYAASASPRQSLVSGQRFKVKSKNNHLPRHRRNTSALTLVCTARPLP